MTTTAEIASAAVTKSLARVRRSLFLGKATDPSWERPLLILLIGLNCILNFTNLGINGWGNYYYSATVQSGAADWQAFFFGSSDWANSITVDKPPLSLWLMGLSVRIFGLSPLSLLAPQAILGVSSSVFVYAILRRNFGAAASLVAMTIFFTTPIITLMSRYNNPDPLMIFLMLAAVYLVLKNIDTGLARYMMYAGVLLGLSFMTKQLQGLAVLPFAGVAYLGWSAASWASKLRVTASALTAITVTGGLWMLLVELTPASNRPYVGGSSGNSVLELTFGYNGIDRLVPNHEVAAASMLPEKFRQVTSDAGFARLLNANYGQEIAWLLFATLFASLVLILFWRRLPNKRGARATTFLAISWFVTTYLMLSFMGNQIHTYYTAALAPALALVAGIAFDLFLRQRGSILIRASACFALVLATLTSWMLLGSTWGWPDWLPPLVLSTGLLAASLLVAKPPTWKISAFACLLATTAVLTGPVLTAIHSTSVPHRGSNPVSGHLSRNPGSINQFLHELRQSSSGGAYEIGFGRDPDEEVAAKLQLGRTCKWSAATYPSQTAARLQLSLEKPVMPLGGFLGMDPSPTLETFILMVDSGQICFFIAQDGYLKIQTERVDVHRITEWIAQHYGSENLNGHTIYDLTKGRRS